MAPSLCFAPGLRGGAPMFAWRRRRSERWRGDEPISLAPCPPCVARTSRAGVLCRAGANRTHAMPRSCWNWPTGDRHPVRMQSQACAAIDCPHQMLRMCEAAGVGCGSVLEGRQKLPAQAGSAEAEVGADLISQGSDSGQKREKACLLVRAAARRQWREQPRTRRGSGLIQTPRRAQDPLFSRG